MRWGPLNDHELETGKAGLKIVLLPRRHSGNVCIRDVVAERSISLVTMLHRHGHSWADRACLQSDTDGYYRSGVIFDFFQHFAWIRK